MVLAIGAPSPWSGPRGVRAPPGPILLSTLALSHITLLLYIVFCLFVAKSFILVMEARDGSTRTSEISMNPVGRAIGEVIRFYRGRHNMTQEQLAKRAGIAPTSVVRLENGEIERPRISTLTKIADALEMDQQELTSFVVRNPLD